MSTTTPSKNTSQSTPSNHKVEPAKAPEPVTTAAPVETPKTEAAVDTSEKTKGTTVVSLVFSNQIAKKLRLIARIEGVSMSKIVVASIEREIPARLKAALASLSDDEVE